MSELTPSATLRILEGHGHSCLIAPDMDLAAIVAEWLARRSPGEGGMDDANR